MSLSPGSGATFNIRFPGQYYDAETGLHYNRFRYYDPSIGRYISADPIGQLGGANVYSYALNSPANFVDPRGLIAGVDDVAAVVGATLLAGGAAVYCHFAGCGEAVADAVDAALDAAAEAQSARCA